MGLGLTSVSSAKRVPRPPARFGRHFLAPPRFAAFFFILHSDPSQSWALHHRVPAIGRRLRFDKREESRPARHEFVPRSRLDHAAGIEDANAICGAHRCETVSNNQYADLPAQFLDRS
jgi:hypothetical protein